MPWRGNGGGGWQVCDGGTGAMVEGGVGGTHVCWLSDRLAKEARRIFPTGCSFVAYSERKEHFLFVSKRKRIAKNRKH